MKKINEMHPPMNNAGVSFATLLVYAPMHQNLDSAVSPVYTTIAGSKEWSLNLFQTVPEFYWVQVNQKVSIGVSSLHAIVFHVLK